MLRSLLSCALLLAATLALTAPGASADCVSTFRSDTQTTVLEQRADLRDRQPTEDYLKRQAGNESAATVRDAAASGPSEQEHVEGSLAYCTATDYDRGSGMVYACSAYLLGAYNPLGNPLAYSPWSAVAAAYEVRACATS